MSYWFQPTTVSLSIGGRSMTLEVGRLAKQAAGSVLVSYGDTTVLVTTTRAKPRLGIDFFPLTVDFVEKFAAAGKIPGGFFKREGRLQTARSWFRASSIARSGRCSRTGTTTKPR
jgi:polyribonucleotide nucleotidyltransferase